jgi:photosystem II stability/assembly factor-like uncharacterized protein
MTRLMPLTPGIREPYVGRRVRAGLAAAIAAVALTMARVEAQTWTNVTGNLAYKVSECGTLTLVSGVPDSEAVIAGVAARGLWVNSTGTTWSRLTDAVESDRIDNRPSSIIFDPANPATFWESGIYNGPGVYKTTDGGKSFVKLGDVVHNDSVSVDFADPERRTLLAGSHEQGQTLYRSIDGGKTWKNIGVNLPPGSGATTQPFVIDAMTFLVNGVTDSPLGGIYRSTDGGDSWKRVATHASSASPLRTANGTLYWATTGRLLRSTDLGATWTAAPIEGLRPIRPIEPNSGTLVAVGQSTLLRSSDGGATWEPLGGPLPYSPDGMAYSAKRQSIFIWRGECKEHVAANAVMKLDLGPAAARQ